MLTLPKYREVRLYRPPPPPPPDRLPDTIRGALTGFFTALSLVLIAALEFAPEPESDRIREMWQRSGFTPPPFGRDVIVLQGKLRLVVFDSKRNRIALATERGPVEIWDTLEGKRVSVVLEQPREFGSLTFSPNGKSFITVEDFRSRAPLALVPAVIVRARMVNVQTGELSRMIPIVLPADATGCEVHWLDERTLFVRVAIQFTGGGLRYSYGQIDILSGKWTAADAPENDDVFLRNQINAKEKGVSKQFGKCYVWSANDETRISVNQYPTSR